MAKAKVETGVKVSSQESVGPETAAKSLATLATADEAKVRLSKKAMEEITGGERKSNPMQWVRDPLMVSTGERKLRKRPGWHQTWCRGDQFDDFMEMGYRQVRKAKDGESVGEESGEVVKIKEGEDRTLIAVEIPEEVYQEHLKAVAYRSHVRYSHDARQTFEDHVRGMNKDYGSRKEVLRVVEEGEEPVERLEKRSSRIKREGGDEDEE